MPLPDNDADWGIVPGTNDGGGFPVGSFADFRGNYYGPYPADPTESPLGLPLTAGALYFNTVTLEFNVYGGSSWSEIGPFDSIDVIAAQTAATAALASQTAAAASATTAATQATNAGTQATNAATSASAAASSASSASGSASSAATQATNAATSATAAATSATAALASQTAAGTQATNAATQATNAAASASTAATQAAAAAASATAAATSATTAAVSQTAATASQAAALSSATDSAASASAAATSASNASTSASTASTQATNAATSATSAGTQATNAATSATAAASSATAASGSATTAGTQATNAATSATAATTQATNAATSATNAATSATNAATSATNAAASALAAEAAAETVAYGASAYHISKANYETQVGAGDRDYPELLPVLMYMGTLSTGTVNADGTYPLAASATWTSRNLNFAPFNVAGDLYCYVVLDTPTDTDDIQIAIKQGGTTVKAGNTTTQPMAGVYYQTWNNSAPLTHVNIIVTNVSAGTRTIYPVEVYDTNTDYLPQILNMADVVSVPENRRVIDWDTIAPYTRWGLSDNIAGPLGEKNITVAFDSVSGSDGAAGTRYAPKQTLDAGSTLAQDATVGFKRASVWRESYGDMGSSTKGITLRNYSDGRVGQDLPLIKGCLSLGGYTWTLESGTCWKTTYTCDAAATSYDGYSYVKVIQTTVADATDQPLGATQALTRASSKANCVATVGSFFTEDTTSTTRTVYVNPNDGIIPSSSTLYTYEATNRYCVVNWVAGNARMGVMQGIEVYDSAFGYGPISGGPQSMFAGIIASHGGTHTLKMEAGEIRDFIMYNKGFTSSSAGNCYLSPNADGYSWRWTNGMAYYCYPSPFYSHNAAGTYTNGEYSYIWVDGERQANGALIMGDGFVCDNVATALTEWCYVKGRQRNGRSGTYVVPCNATLRNCLFRESGIFYSHALTENCIVQVENQSDPDSVNNRNSIMTRISEDHIVQNCLIHAKNTDVSGYPAGLSDYNTTCFDVVATGLNNPNIRRNIYLVDTTLATGQTIISETAAITWTSDYNVFIFCTAANISSFKFGGGGTKERWDNYVTDFAPHDANSLCIDLRDDPRGAQAVFIDPDNGDYRWAQTEVAEKIKAYCIANNVGPDWTIAQWPTMPTVDEARAMLMKAY